MKHNAMETPDSSRQERAKTRLAGVILVVDDDQAICELLSDFLESLGFLVMTARNGAAALAQIARMRPNLVITDLSMPGIDGAELCERLNKDAKTVRIPRVLMSAWRGQLSDSRRHGHAHAYLHKPFDLDTVEHLVRVLLESSAPALPPI